MFLGSSKRKVTLGSAGLVSITVGLPLSGVGCVFLSPLTSTFVSGLALPSVGEGAVFWGDLERSRLTGGRCAGSFGISGVTGVGGGGNLGMCWSRVLMTVFILSESEGLFVWISEKIFLRSESILTSPVAPTLSPILAKTFSTPPLCRACAICLMSALHGSPSLRGHSSQILTKILIMLSSFCLLKWYVSESSLKNFTLFADIFFLTSSALIAVYGEPPPPPPIGPTILRFLL